MIMWWLFYSTMLRNDVLIENNKYGYVTMQNNEIVNLRMHKRLKPGVLSLPVNAGYKAKAFICYC